MLSVAVALADRHVTSVCVRHAFTRGWSYLGAYVNNIDDV